MWFPARGKLAVNGAFGNVGGPLDRLGGGLLGGPFHPSAARHSVAARWAAARRSAISGPAFRTSREYDGSTFGKLSPKIARSPAGVAPCAPSPGASNGPFTLDRSWPV